MNMIVILVAAILILVISIISVVCTTLNKQKTLSLEGISLPKENAFF